MVALLTMMAGLALAAQEPAQPAEPVTTLPPVEVVAGASQGVVALECRINRDGTLRDCEIISETPAGQGFGEAALANVSRSRLSRDTLRNVEPDGTVSFNIRFQLAD